MFGKSHRKQVNSHQEDQDDKLPAMKRNETTVLMVIMVAVALMMILVNPGTFLTQNNLKGMAFQLPELGILTFAMMGVMITGGINLSIIATANMAGISAALVLKAMESSPVAGLLLAVITALAVSGGIGLINGTLIAYVGITPILATLGTMTLFTRSRHRRYRRLCDLGLLSRCPVHRKRKCARNTLSAPCFRVVCHWFLLSY